MWEVGKERGDKLKVYYMTKWIKIKKQTTMKENQQEEKDKIGRRVQRIGIREKVINALRKIKATRL